MSNILITGGTGLIGTHLTGLLLQKGHHVKYLSRSKRRVNVNYNGKREEVFCYQWDIDNGTIEEEAFEETDYIIHLAGASVGERWTPSYKKEIKESRVKTAALLRKNVRKNKYPVKAFISASGVNYYGDNGDKWLTEDKPAGTDFLAQTCEEWERQAFEFENPDTRVVTVRTGVVMAQGAEAMELMAKPIKFFVGAPVGSGNQYVSWIHIDDLCQLYLKAIEDENMSGPYNGCTPTPITNKELTKALADQLHRPLILPNVPAFALRLVLGDMADVALFSNRASAEKLLKTGFEFKYTDINKALKDVYGN